MEEKGGVARPPNNKFNKFKLKYLSKKTSYDRNVNKLKHDRNVTKLFKDREVSKLNFDREVNKLHDRDVMNMIYSKERLITRVSKTQWKVDFINQSRKRKYQDPWICDLNYARKCNFPVPNKGTAHKRKWKLPHIYQVDNILVSLKHSGNLTHKIIKTYLFMLNCDALTFFKCKNSILGFHREVRFKKDTLHHGGGVNLISSFAAELPLTRIYKPSVNHFRGFYRERLEPLLSFGETQAEKPKPCSIVESGKKFLYQVVPGIMTAMSLNDEPGGLKPPVETQFPYLFDKILGSMDPDDLDEITDFSFLKINFEELSYENYYKLYLASPRSLQFFLEEESSMHEHLCPKRTPVVQRITPFDAIFDQISEINERNKNAAWAVIPAKITKPKVKVVRIKLK